MSKVSHDSETPAQGQQVIVACAFIHHNFDGLEKLFSAKRAATKKFMPNVYELPGGHIDFGEDIVAGLKREVYEEFGMNIRVGDPFYVFSYINEIKGSHSIEVGYFASFEDSFSNIKIHPEDHSEYGWFAESDLETVLSSNRLDNDPEIAAMKRGFALLRGEPLTF